MFNQVVLAVFAVLTTFTFLSRLVCVFFLGLIEGARAWLYRNTQKPLRVRISACTQNGRVTFRVEDNGSGIATEYRDQVLEMFSRLVPNNEQHPGTGMGLALVVKALRSVNGQVSIEGGMQGGTAIVFDLPATR